VRCGTEILTEKGFNSTGLDEVLKRVGVPKGSFYHYFESKEDFGLVVIDSYADYFARKLDRWLLNAERAPLERIADFIADARRGMARHDFRRGCLIGNLGQETGALPAAYRERLEQVFLDWQARLACCLEAAQAQGALSSKVDCARIAAFFWIGWEGAVLRAKLVASPEPLDIFADGFFAGLSH
jgi:TetR/AcrR family transcriptional repressor of nem operon